MQAADFLGCHQMKAQITQWLRSALLSLVQDPCNGAPHLNSSPKHGRVWHISKV